jgi:hypothetical protein
MHDDYDRTGKWLIDHHGNVLLWLANIRRPIKSWRAVPTELVQPKQMPDGLLEVVFEGLDDVFYFLIEIATYPERRVSRQMLRDALMVFLDRDILPEMVTLVLRPVGNATVPHSDLRFSKLGTTRLEVSWNVAELWRIPAAELLAANDLGIVPWVVLAEHSEPPEKILRECRKRLDECPDEDDRASLLAVCQVLAGLRYEEKLLKDIFGGYNAMIESPVLDKFWAEAKHRTIQQVLEGRFGPLPDTLAEQLFSVMADDQLSKLASVAGTIPDLNAFAAALASVKQGT